MNATLNKHRLNNPIRGIRTSITFFQHQVHAMFTLLPSHRAAEAHEAFVALLKTIVAKKELLKLYAVIMREHYKKNGQDKSKHTKELQAQIEKLNQQVQNAQALMLDAELSAAEYLDIRTSFSTEIVALEHRKVVLLTSEDDYEHYLNKGMPILQNIYKHWLAADRWFYFS